MRDIAWFTRTTSTSKALRGFAVLEGVLYYLRYTGLSPYGTDLYRLNSYAKSDTSTITVDSTKLVTPGAGLFDSRVLYAAQGKLWVALQNRLWNYDPVAGTLAGPWSPPIAGSPWISDIIEYNGDIYVLSRFSSGGTWSNLSRFTGAALVTVAQEQYSASYHSLAVFQGLLYWASLQKLKTWNGSVAATVYTFSYPPDCVGAMYNLNDTTLYVGIGNPYNSMGAHPKLYSWDGANMNYILQIESVFFGLPRVFALRQPTEMYAIVRNTTILTESKRVYLIDPIGATVSVDHQAGTGEFNYEKELIYWSGNDSVWEGCHGTKTSFVIARRPETYFLLA